MPKRIVKPLAFALALSFTSSQAFAFAPTLLPPITQNFQIQNLETIKDSRGLEERGKEKEKGVKSLKKGVKSLID